MKQLSHFTIVFRKHLHIRGENFFSAFIFPFQTETPPHTWRKFLSRTLDENFLRNTSTYVEKIYKKRRSSSIRQKHLHIRGENLKLDRVPIAVLETPPHTWRKFFSLLDKRIIKRNTSTYVEKINPSDCQDRHLWKHLHIRGENKVSAATPNAARETPPHTWRK